MSGSVNKKEAFSRAVIDAQFKDIGWNLTDGQSVHYEYYLTDGKFADYVLSDRHDRAMAVGASNTEFTKTLDRDYFSEE